MSSVTCNAAGLPPLCTPGALATRAPMATHNQATCGERRNVGRGWRVGAFPVWAFGFGHIAGCEAPAGPLHSPQKQMASTVTYWAICASASNSLTRDAHVTDDTARHLRYTSRAKREADVSLSHHRTGINGCSALAHPLTHLTHGIPTRRPFHPAKTASMFRG